MQLEATMLRSMDAEEIAPRKQLAPSRRSRLKGQAKHQ
jgi:hypothetical protein